MHSTARSRPPAQPAKNKAPALPKLNASGECRRYTAVTSYRASTGSTDTLTGIVLPGFSRTMDSNSRPPYS